jgi:BirA family transcriptional regulator, biotin operon repressor / biotin---[acetyl-CoA-carboxylase] ligase
MNGIILPPGVTLHALKKVDSTNSEALRRIAGGAGAFEAVWARSQTAGRGRDGRVWVSPAGNLYVSIVAEVPPGRPAAQLAFVAALAAGDAILGLCAPGCDLRYKWPNDLLIGGRKTGGILIEGNPAGKECGKLAIGIGINVESAPERASWPATCLRGEGAPDVTVEALLEGLLCSLVARFETWRADGFRELRRAWLERAYGLGRPLSARLPGGAIYDGMFRDLDADGALVLDQGAFGLRSIAAGDVMFPAGR